MSAIIEKARNHVRETKRHLFLQSLGLINGAFALVAALAWNEAIKGLIDKYFKAGSGLYSRFAYAVIITVIVVLVARYIDKFSKRYEEETNESS